MDREEYIQSKSNAIARRQLNDYRRVLNMPEGRRIVWDLLQMCNFRHHGYVPHDAAATAFNCGQISIGLYIADIVSKANFPALEQMEQEFIAEQKQLNKELNDVEDL